MEIHFRQFHLCRFLLLEQLLQPARVESTYIATWAYESFSEKTIIYSFSQHQAELTTEVSCKF